ncbi:hypothetical protein [Mycolicibacterium parafortuitum]|uniref:hypothetical protein n=1 Tax=Mycolicibacterium parafortuitum TaxID=39692 RepID=UPI0032C3FCB0
MTYHSPNVDGVAAHVQAPTQRVDVADVQPGQLSPPDAAVSQDQDDGSLVASCSAGRGLLGELPDLIFGEVLVATGGVAWQLDPARRVHQ